MISPIDNAAISATMKFPVATNSAKRANPIEITRPYSSVSTSFNSVIMMHQSSPAVYFAPFTPL